MTTDPQSVIDAGMRGEATLPQLLRARAALHPDALAMRRKELGIWDRIGWGRYYETVRLFALGLRQLGFEPGDVLAIASEDTPEWMMADLATQAAGGVCVGVYPTNPWPELQYILRHSRAKVAVCGDQEQVDKVLDAQSHGAGLPDLRWIVVVDDKGMRGYPRDRLTSFAELVERGRARLAADGDRLDREIDAGRPDDVAVIVYTSGTTGAPKGAMLTHRNFLCAAAPVVRSFGFNAGTYSTVCYLPLCHVAERSFSEVMQLLSGSVINFAESVDTVAANLREIAPLGFLGVPRIWEKMQQTVTIRIREATGFQRWAYRTAMRLGGGIADRGEAAGREFAGPGDRLLHGLLTLALFGSIKRFLGLDRARACFAGAASVSPDVLRFFRILGIRIHQVYGLTETAAVAFQQRPGHLRLGYTGLPVDGLEYRIAEDGELLVRGPSVFRGYLHDPEATAKVLKDGWLSTGDVVKRHPDGEIAIVDRKKDIIITSGGKNIAPSELEAALKESDYIKEAIILGDGRHFVAALIQIDFFTVGKWAQEANLTFTTYKSLVTLPETVRLIEGEVNRINQRFARVEQIRRFRLLTKELDHDDGELTATMKVRRSAIEKKFSAEIAAIYGEKV